MSSRQTTPERSTGWEWSPCWLVVRKRKPVLRERGVGRANLIGHHNSNFTAYQKSKAATHYSCPMAAIINSANSVASKINLLPHFSRDKSAVGPNRLKSRCRQGWFLLEAVADSPFPGLQLPWGAYMPWLVASPPICKATALSESLPCCCL